MMGALEARQQPYLRKLRPSKNVRRHIGGLFGAPGRRDAGQGWEGLEGELALSGWARKRRDVVLRRALTGQIAVAGEHDQGQRLLAFVERAPAALRSSVS